LAETGKGKNKYVGKELIEAVEEFQEIGDFDNFREASSALGRALKKDNTLLRTGEDLVGTVRDRDMRSSDDGSGDDQAMGGGFALG